MSAQDTFSAELAAWLAVEARAPVPSSALDRALQATSARRPRPSLVAGVASHWIGAVPKDAPGRVAVRAPLTARRLVIVALMALLAVALAGAAILVGGGFERSAVPEVLKTWPGPVQAGVLPMQPLALAQPLAVDRIGELAWTDGRDTPIDWLDLTRVRVSPEGQAQWRIELADRPPRAEGLDAAETIDQLRTGLRDDRR